MMDQADELIELIKQKCEQIENEQRKLLAEQRKSQEDICKRTKSYGDMYKDKLINTLRNDYDFGNDTETSLKQLMRRQIRSVLMPTFIIVTMVFMWALRQVGYRMTGGSIIRIFFVSFVLTLGIGVAMFCVLKSMKDRMMTLSKALEQVSLGNVDYRLDASKAGPMAKAYIDYNEMAEKIKMYQQQMIESVEEAERANRAKSDFLSNMSHEIRTPMNAIVGMTDILLRGDIEGKQREYLMNIKNSGASLLTIINDILDFSKIESGKLEIIEDNYEPMSMLNDLSMIFLNRIGDKHVDLIYDIDSNFPSGLYGDSIRVRQVLINITNNAIKFTERGSVTLKIRIKERKGDVITLLFEIIDTGQGIKEEDLGKLFNSFAQVDSRKNHHKEGTGLGLAISKQLVELMNGEIGVKSKYGEGSTFYFTIEQKVTKDTPIPVQNGPQKVTLGSLSYGSVDVKEEIKYTAPNAHILIVDDNEINLKVACGLLEPIGMQIDTAADGLEAINKVQNKEYDLIFMDHMMPEMDGLEATARIRSLGGEYYSLVPIIALTANAVAEDREGFFKVGMNDFVAKPINVNEIFACLLQWLPEKKIIKAKPDNKDGQDAVVIDEELNLAYPKGLDYKLGISRTGSKKLYFEVLGDFYRLIDMKSDKIERCLANSDIRDYTVEVHALKNLVGTIGDRELADRFKELEMLGKEENVSELERLTPGVLESYRALKDVLKDYAPTIDTNEVSVGVIIESLGKLQEAADNFDLTAVDEQMGKIRTYKFPIDIADSIDRLEAYVADVAMDEIKEVADSLIDRLQDLVM